MLKIKDSVDLKELEKFGFRKHKKDSEDVLTSKWSRDYIEPEYMDGHRIANGGWEFYPLISILENREIEKCYEWSWRKERIDKAMQDLIKADMVEKVEG